MEQREPSQLERNRNGLNAVIFVAGALAMPSEVFLRRCGTFGAHHFGFQALVGLLAIPLWGVFWPEEDATWLLCFLCMVLVMLLVIRIRTGFRRHPQLHIHSRYGGQPRLVRAFGEHREQILKCAIEPLITFLTGALIFQSNHPLGSFLMCSAAGLFITANAIEAAIRARVRGMNDALLEQREVLDRWIAMQRNHKG